MSNDHFTRSKPSTGRISVRAGGDAKRTGRAPGFSEPGPRQVLPTRGSDPEASESFARLNLSPGLLAAAKRSGYTRPTPIQCKAIPLLLEGRDLMASAATGSGKTAAFLLPILQRLQGRPQGTTRALILTPTRELAAQILEHLAALSPGTGVRGAAVYGGVAQDPQVKAFQTGVDVIIATPGRLLDHFQHAYAKLPGLEVLVLDEADRMLDMGFLPDVKRILNHIPRQRQTLLFSATLPAPILELAQRMLKDPASVHIEPKPMPARGITHRAYAVPSELKTRLLLEILRQEEPGRVLAFTRTRHRANRLADFLDKHSVPCARIHGSRSQAQRTEALAGFRKGLVQVLVATDIAARGLDVTALDLVVNFDVPGDVEDYIHRVGRTARAEATGSAYTLFAPDEEDGLGAIERGIGRRLPRETISGFDYRQTTGGRFEVPLAERIAMIRARKAEDRARAKAKAERRSREAERVLPRRVAGDPGGKTFPGRGPREAPVSGRWRPPARRTPARSGSDRS